MLYHTWAPNLLPCLSSSLQEGCHGGWLPTFPEQSKVISSSFVLWNIRFSYCFPPHQIGTVGENGILYRVFRPLFSEFRIVDICMKKLPPITVQNTSHEGLAFRIKAEVISTGKDIFPVVRFYLVFQILNWQSALWAFGVELWTFTGKFKEN